MGTRDESGRARGVGEIQGDSRTLSSLLRRAQAYAELSRRLAPALPDKGREQIRVAAVEDGCLVLAATSPAWASRARALASTLLEKAREIWPAELKRVRVIVVPPPEF